MRLIPGQMPGYPLARSDDPLSGHRRYHRNLHKTNVRGSDPKESASAALRVPSVVSEQAPLVLRVGSNSHLKQWTACEFAYSWSPAGQSH